MAHILCTVTNDLVYDQRMIRICRSLARAGYRVELVGRERPGSPALPQMPFQQTRLRCFFEKGKLFYLEYNLRLFGYLLSHPFDVVCSVDLDTLLPGYLVSRIRRKKIVYDAHEYFTEVPEVVDRPLVKGIWSLLARWIIPRLTYAYTVGAALADALTKRYGAPFAVIRNLPAARSETAEPDPGRPPVVLYQGYLNEGRGLETAIGAMRRLTEAELWLAGEGDLSQKLRALAEQLGVTDRVRFLGALAPDEMRQVTLCAAIGINLLENRGLSYYYSLANKALEYVQAGLPSIQMDFPEYRRLQDACGIFHLLSELSENELVQAVERLLSDTGYYQQIRQNCLDHRNDLTWDKEEQVLLDFYRRVTHPIS